jgi:hypothetical protein
MSDTAARHILSPKLAKFIGDPRMTIDACSRNIQLIPSIARGLACKADLSTERISFWISARRSKDFIADLRCGHALAIVICLPSTHQTIQIKGHHATIQAPQHADLAYIEQKIQFLTSELGTLGFSQEYCDRMIGYSAQDVLHICFTSLAVFEQSPGSNAGKMLEVSSW